MPIVSLLFAGAHVTGFAPARQWIAGWGAAPGIPFVADMSGKGRAEMVSFNPTAGVVDVLPTVDGFKPSNGYVALSNFGAKPDAVCVGTPTVGKSPVVVGLYGGTDLKLGKKDSNGAWTIKDKWATLSSKVGNPVVAVVSGDVFAFSSRDGSGYVIDTETAHVEKAKFPSGTVWIGDAGSDLVGKDREGQVFFIDRATHARKATLGFESIGSRPAAMPGLVVFGSHAWIEGKITDLDSDGLAPCDVIRGVAPSGKFGRPLVYEWRRGTELGTGTEVEVRRSIIDEDKTLNADDPESDSYNRVSGNDGLLDGWKRFGYRGIDFAKLGCKVGHADVVCLISRFNGVAPATVDNAVKRIEQFYSGLKTKNLDGTTGIGFHAILLDEVKGPDESQPWWANRGKFLPEKWRGLVHWMQVTPGGGGQSNVLADGGTCGQNALWAVFVHEFGHQLGLNHEGFSPGYASPIYTSLMNYTYSYGFNGSMNNVHYSDGRFASLKLNENDLDETLPFPLEQLSFLGKPPYSFPIKANGPSSTEVDWNRNGIFGEKHVKASITYAYSIGAGARDELGRMHIKTAPWLFSHDGRAYLLYGTNDLPADPKVDPSLSPERPGRLQLRRMIKPTVWEPEQTIELAGVTGDPVAVSVDGRILAVYQTLGGVMARYLSATPDGIEMTSPVLVAADRNLIPTVGSYGGHAYIFLTNLADGKLTYRIADKGGLMAGVFSFAFRVSNPPGLTTDTRSGEAILALGQDQADGRKSHLQYRRMFAAPSGQLFQNKGPVWVSGEKGNTAGSGRVIPLFDASKDAGPSGRVILVFRGYGPKTAISACGYQAHEIADQKFGGGWLVMRYYDEWSTSRSAPAACWFGDDMLYSYRWADGSQSEADNVLHVAYRGTGLQANTLTDFDDVSYVRNFGLSNSIPVLGAG